MTTAVAPPTARSLALAPAILTLGVTLLRLALELAGSAGWLASNAGGGGFAVVGITWLPVLFGPWFALRIRSHVPGGKAYWLRLWKTLTVYGLMARVPVFLLTIVAVFGDWGTHYEKFGDMTGIGARIGVAFVAQLAFWACVWTPIVGLLAALVTLALRPRAPALDVAA